MFETLPDAYLVLSPELTILAASPLYLRLSHTKQQDILGRSIFEVFPRRLDTDGIPVVQASLNRVKETLLPHQMEIIRYDLPDTSHPGELIERYWSTSHTPVLNEDSSLWYIIHRTDDITGQVKARQMMAETHQVVQTTDHELLAAANELRASNEELTKASEALEQFNSQLEERVAERTHELNLAKEAIQQERDQLYRFFMRAPVAICLLKGPEMVYELINPNYQQLFPARELLGRPLREALPELVDQPAWSFLEEVYNTGKPYRAQEALISTAQVEGGTLENRYYNFVYHPRFDEENQVDSILVVAYEVTDQVEARKTAEASAHQLQLVTDALPVLISYLDQDETYRFANRAYQSWFALSPDEIIGQPIRSLVGEKAYRAVKPYIDRALAGERLTYEAEMHYREDFTKHTHTSFVPHVQDDKVVGFYALVNDVTDQVQSRREIEEREREARTLAQQLTKTNQILTATNGQLGRTNADLDNFIYTASHDLKAPISNIESLIAALIRTLPQEQIYSEQTQRIFSMIDTSVERFKQTINQLTEIVKLQKEHSGDAIFVSLPQIIQEVWQDLALLVQDSGAEMTLEVEECLPILISEKNIRSVIYNLLSNAIKYRLPGRTPRVYIRCFQAEHYQVLSVKDNGLGIEKERLPQLFSMFKRFHDHVEGSGVGLYMVKKIVDRAGGKITVDSHPNEGTTFCIYFKKAED